MAIPEDTTAIVMSGAVLAGAAIAGIAFGLTAEYLGHRNGKPTTAKRAVRIIEHGLRGFALGSIVAGTVLTLLKGD